MSCRWFINNSVVRRKLSSGQCRRYLSVLALESSADDTCAAIVTSHRQILSNVVIKQHDLHEKFGGIYPYEAIEAHQRNMPIAIRRALQEADIDATDLDGIAFTRGPGMGGCLSVGSNAAKALAAALKKPLVGVHHMQAHALTPFLSLPPADCPTFPFLSLLISGGHTLLLLARAQTSFTILATTYDESIGNAFDKVSRCLGLPWSSHGPGAALEHFCQVHPLPAAEESKLKFPLSMRGQLAFSFTGLYSQVQRYIAAVSTQEFTATHRAQVAWAFQRAAVGQLEEKVRLGLRWCMRHDVDVPHVVVSGGVASNLFLRERLQQCLDDMGTPYPVALAFPPVELCTDNAAMVAWAAMHRIIRNDHDPYEISLKPTWSIEDLHL